MDLGNPLTCESIATKTETSADLIRAALIKFEITEDELSRVPRFSEILEVAAGGLPGVLGVMRFSQDPNIERFLAAYDSAHTQDRENLPWEIFALIARVDVRMLLGAIIFALREQSANMVKVIAFSHHPAAVKARVESAMLPGKEGSKDRDSLDVALKFMPAKAGSTFISLPGGTVNMGPDSGEPVEANENDVFPSLADMQQRLLKE